MMIRGYSISARIIGMVIGALLLIGAVTFGVTQCQQRKSQAAQSRVDKGQSGAANASAKDAVETVTAAGQREAGSEQLTRDNERDIRAADGAGERIKPGVDYAGRKALCRRDAYRNDPRCKGTPQ